MIHIPLLRAGQPYESLQVEPLVDLPTGRQIGELSQASPGMIARDLDQLGEHRRLLEKLTAGELVALCRDAAHHFAHGELPLGRGTQTPDDYVRQLAATSGMPEAMGRANMGKIVGVLEGMKEVLDGLTRGLDLGVLDGGWGRQDGRALSYQSQTDGLGLVLPNNSPGVHSLWLPAIPLKVPLVIKPGSAEPWTPYRIVQAFVAAGCPPQVFSFYPTDHGGAAEVLLRTGRSLFFGDANTVRSWEGSGKVQVHGPGWSKLILGPDAAADWQRYLEVLIGSVAANGGRSCINASSIWTPSHGRELAAAMAERLASVEARPLDHPEAQLAAFPNPQVAHAISEMIDQELERPGAEDLTAGLRGGSRVAEAGGCTFLLPTLIYCDDPAHPLARAEYVFPFASVVQAPQDQLLSAIGPTLVGSVITEDDGMQRRALTCRHIDRLNLGPIPTYQISWDQPHEGNLFDHLYQQRAFQSLETVSA